MTSVEKPCFRAKARALLPEKLFKRGAKLYHGVFARIYSRDLARLADLFRTDKGGGHGYTQFYELFFRRLRKKSIRLLEIGIGGYRHASEGGGSLRMWRAYFRRGRITGLDIHDKSGHRGKRIEIYQGSQSDPEVASRIIEEQGPFDIIIDDGSHRCEHVLASFELYFPALKKGGFYVVEDTQTSYWARYGGDARNLNRLESTMGFFKSLVDGLNHAEISPEARPPGPWDTEILSISFFHNLIFIEKGNNTQRSNIGA